MRRIVLALALVICGVLLGGGTAHGAIVEPSIDRPDPYILWDGSSHLYRLYTTNTIRGNVPEYTATNLLGPWTYTGDALPVLPSWGSAFSTWAPEVRDIYGQWTLWASDLNKQGSLCLFRATASTAAGPFMADPHQLTCTPEGRIDPTPVYASGEWWIVWKTNGFGLTPMKPTTFVSQRLNHSGLPFGPTHVLLTSMHPWAKPQIEAPSFVQSPTKQWWLIFSGGTVTPTDPTYQIYGIPCSSLTSCDANSATLMVRSTPAQPAPGEDSTFTDAQGHSWIAYNPNGYFLQSDRRPLALVRLKFPSCSESPEGSPLQVPE